MLLIFLTGAAVLALEVLASRIMTPYFGVSLYIWASILSITLSFLALGYWLGGALTRRLPPRLHAMLFLALPIAAAASILLASALYPSLFPALARVDLVLGSFIAGTVLLALPLIGLSAMNPLLIAMRLGGGRAGDAGAGQVFFVSTVGSVAGVIVTAFAIIPNFTNFSALLWLCLVLCALAAAAACASGALPRPGKLRLCFAALVVAAPGAGLLAAQERYLAYLTEVPGADTEVVVLAEYTSVFGNVKVVRLRSASGRYPPSKALLQDGIVQNRTDTDNRSLSMYTYVLERLAEGFVPEARRALVLGLGAGIVPRGFRRRGLAVTIVDINPSIVEAAQSHFGFDPSDYALHVGDARTFVRRCQGAFDIVVVDLFQGDGTPDYLLTREFFADLKRCLSRHGAVAMNAFFDEDEREPNMRLLATVQAVFGYSFVFHQPRLNSFIVGMSVPPPEDIDFPLESVPAPLRPPVQQVLAAGQRVRPTALLGYAPLTDQQNLFSVLAAQAQLNRRRDLVEALPPRVLVN